MVELIAPTKEEVYEEHSAPLLKPAAVKPKMDLGKILTDAAMRHPKEVNDFLDEYVGSEGKSLIISTVKEAKPEIGMIIDKIFPSKHNIASGRTEIEEADDKNPLDDNDLDRDYNIPDTEILDEIRQFACSLHLSGYGWAQIGDSIFQKYDVDWNPLKIKDIVLKNLAWNHRTLQPAPQIPIETPQKPPEQRKGLIRRFVSWLY